MITIFRLVLRETLRRKLLWVPIGLTVVLVAITSWGFGQLISTGAAPHTILLAGVGQLLVFVAFMFSFVLTMTAVFAAAPSIAGPLESGVFLALLARPIRRAELLLGTWAALALVISAYAVGAGALEIGAVALVTGFTPREPIIALVFLAAEGSLLVTLALAFSTRLPVMVAGSIAAVSFGLSWVAGILEGMGRAFDNAALIGMGDAIKIIFPVDTLWRGVVWALGPADPSIREVNRVINSTGANPFSADQPPGVLALAWVIAWGAIVVGIAIVSFRRREI
jgi:ABC-type transport system involved in multi-copper enzyme maturation permease subunit